MPTIEEQDLTIPTVALLSNEHDGFLSTSKLIDRLSNHFKPTGVDANILRNRNDTHFSQKVRNMVSHRQSKTGLQERGLAVYIKQRGGWQITDEGKNYIKRLNKSAE